MLPSAMAAAYVACAEPAQYPDGMPPFSDDGNLSALIRLADKAIDTFGTPLAQYVGETLGEPIKNAIGVVVSDPLAFYRLEKIAERMQRTKEKLDARGIRNVRPIPPKLAVGLLDGASLEENPDLQELWDTLIANAFDPNFKQEIPPAFMAILKEMSPADAILLKCVIQRVWEEWSHRRQLDLALWWYRVMMCDLLENARFEVLHQLPTRDVILAIQNLTRLRLLDIKSEEYHRTEDEYMRSVHFSVYPLGVAFASAVFERHDVESPAEEDVC